jgi:hypothetical protein
MMTPNETKDLLIGTFKTQFTNMPEDLRELKATTCLSFAIRIHKSILKNMSDEQLKQLENELKV